MVADLDLQQIRQALESEHQQLLHSLAEQDISPEMLENPDESDLANLFESQGLQSSLDELDARRLNRIIRALERLNKGTYGICLECEAAIPAERLIALPYAELCVACQAKLEGKDKRV